MTDPNRRTGRTSTMLKNAIMHAREGKNVAVVFRTAREVDNAKRDISVRHHMANFKLHLFGLGEISGCRHKGIDMDYVFIDHHVFDPHKSTDQWSAMMEAMQWANMVDAVRNAGGWGKSVPFVRRVDELPTKTKSWWQRFKEFSWRIWLRIAALWMTLAFVGCITAPPLTALDAKNPWYTEALDIAADWEAHPELPTLDTPLCRRYVERVRVVHTTEQEFGDQTGFCPMTEYGCSTRWACPGDRCVTGSVIVTGGDIVTIFLSPGEDASGHDITVRHEMAHALSACTTGNYDYGHVDRRVWDGLVWLRN